MAMLYEISSKMEYLEELFQSSEIDEETLLDTLEGLDFEFDEKVENIVKLIKNYQADAEMFKQAKNEMAYKQKQAEKNVERLKEYLSFNMQKAGKKKINNGLFSVTLSHRSQSKVVIDDEKLIPDEFMQIKTEIKPRSNEIKKAIKNGEKVAGVHLEDTDVLLIR